MFHIRVGCAVSWAGVMWPPFGVIFGVVRDARISDAAVNSINSRKLVECLFMFATYENTSGVHHIYGVMYQSALNCYEGQLLCMFFVSNKRTIRGPSGC